MTVVTNDDLPLHQVALVVFTDVRAVDFADASFLAEAAVRRALLDAASRESSGELVYRHIQRQGDAGPAEIPVRVHGPVREVSSAANSGYLKVEPALRAYR